MNEPASNVVSLCKDAIIDIVQLHGGEDENYIDALRQRIDNKIIKVVNFQSPNLIFQLPLKADFLLFDSGAGSGQPFDWKLIPKTDKPFFLAGGLNKNNIEDALKLKPYCVDLSGGVETEGQKDFNKIIEIVKIVRLFQ